MNVRTLSACGAALVAVLAWTEAVHAEGSTEGQSGAATSEVVVTARKRSENLQRIPVAVTAQTGAQLQQQRITQPTDMARIVPSLQIDPGSGSDNSAVIALRGQRASDWLLGVSQPVGLYEDSVNIPHPFGSNNAFFDIQRVEVLKGPQGTLYGRNTTGGAINIITRNADFRGVHGFVEGEVGNFGDLRGGVAINIPIIDDVLAVRLAYQHWSQQGFGRSLVSGERFGNDHDDDLARLSLTFKPTPTFDGSLKIEYGRAWHTGVMIADVSAPGPADGFEVFASEALWSNYAKYKPIVQAAAGGDPVAFGQMLQAGQAALAGCVGQSLYVNCSATDQYDHLTTWHAALDLKWTLPAGAMLRLITGMHSFSNTKVFDLDSVQPQLLEIGGASNGLQVSVPGFPLPFPLKPDQTSTQWSQELNLSGTAFQSRLNWLVGAYASWDKGRGAQNGLAATELLVVTTGAPQAINSNDGLSNVTDTWALFTQNDFRFNDVFSLTVGARYTHEHIEQDLAAWNYFPATGSYVCHGANGSAYAPANASDPSSCAADPRSIGPNSQYTRADASGISYLASLNVQIDPNMLFYIKTARGFRGGAFGRVVQVPAKPETDVDYEIGFKGEFFDHRLRTNIAAYWTDYDNKQQQVLVCADTGQPPGPAGCSASPSTLLQNAAKARIRGVELEFLARPERSLSIFGEVSYTDGTYLSFPNAAPSNGAGPINAAGFNLGVVPLWQGDVGVRKEFSVGPGTLGLQADVSYRGAIPLTPLNEDPNTPMAIQRSINGAVTLLNARMDYHVPDWGLTLSLWATNLTNVKWGYQGITSAYTGALGTEVVQPPRTFGVTIRKSFGAED